MSNPFGIGERSFALLEKAIAEFSEIEGAKIFGSRAMGNYKEGSDIDLALMGEEVSDRTVLRLSTYLNEEAPIPYKVDVVAYVLCANEALKRHIDEYGVPL